MSTPILGQSTFDKSIDATGIEEVIIVLDNIFQIDITNTSKDKIIYNAISEGEYKDNILIKSHREHKKLIIQDDVQPFSNSFNDKLSAHKVIAIKASFKIPSHLKVTVRSDYASLNSRGQLKTLFAELKSGDCMLDNFTGDATINTLSGDIKITTKNAEVKAITKLGKLRSQKITGLHKITLNSISGDISVYKTK